MKDLQEPKIQLRIWVGHKFVYSEESSAFIFADCNVDLYYNSDRFSGMTNALGQKVWEGDIVQVLDKRWEIKFECCAFVMRCMDSTEELPHYLGGYADCVVIGNIYEGVK